jgi:hypothetical protein
MVSLLFPQFPCLVANNSLGSFFFFYFYFFFFFFFFSVCGNKLECSGQPPGLVEFSCCISND